MIPNTTNLSPRNWNPLFGSTRRSGEELVQLLMDFRGTIEEEREAKAEELGLTETEFAFHGILMAEITKGEGVETIDEVMHLKIKSVVQQLVAMMDEATEIVDFFQKWDEQRRVRRNIKRAILEFDDEGIVKPVTDRFMELAEGQIPMNLTFDKDLSIKVVRTKRRKTASIKVIDGAVQAIVPDQLSDGRIDALIQRTPWIRKKLREQSRHALQNPRNTLAVGSFTYLGRNYRLKVLTGD